MTELAAQHEWGSDPEGTGPRHDFRESLMLRQLLPMLRDRRTILNAGCGGGSMTMKLLDRGFDVTSVDASEAFVERLRVQLAERRPPVDAPVAVADLRALEAADDSFDAIICGEVLEHIDDDRGVVREFARVLRPGGVVVASVPANPWRYDWCDLYAGHVRRYTPERFASPFVDAGFVDVEPIAWGFPVSGAFHRLVFEPMLKRRLEAGGAFPSARSGGNRLLAPVVRGVLEIDRLFLGRMPGYCGLLLRARMPA